MGRLRAGRGTEVTFRMDTEELEGDVGYSDSSTEESKRAFSAQLLEESIKTF